MVIYMRYIIHYDVAAILLVVTVCVHFFWKKTINTRLTRLFSLLIFLALISNIFDLITMYTIENPAGLPIGLHYLLNQIYLITFNGTSAVYFMYLVAMTKEKSKITRWDRIRMYLPYAVDIILILTTSFTGFIFYFDEEKRYLHGPVFLLLYVIALYYVTSSLIHTIYYRNKLTRGQCVTVYFYTILSLAAMVIQMLNPKLMVIQFAVSIAVLMIYLSLENPQDYTDRGLGTYNRRALLEMLSQYISRDRHYELMGIHVVGVRYINEALGVASGDALLKQIAGYLVQIAGTMKVFYLSGNEFALLSENERSDWDDIMEKVHGYFRKPIAVNGVEVSMSTSMCMLSYRNEAKRLEDAMDMFEISLAEARELGTEGIIYADEEMMRMGRRENQILQLMKHAIKEQGFEVFYQPIYSVEKQRFTSAEALIRMKPKELGFVSPEEFIPIAEKNGLILEIGEFVFREVCRFITEHKLWEAGIECIDVNLSTVQCMQKNLHQTLRQIMDEYHLDYQCINLEITETAAAISGETLRQNMEELIQQGVNFSMDDYGTGFSNIVNLIEYPFHIIKLDKSLVWSAMENEKAMCALKYTIGMVKDMGMKLIAEGVENVEQANELAAMGCDFFQGYYYSKPINGGDFLKRLAE